jgi:hypothetical protein
MITRISDKMRWFREYVNFESQKRLEIFLLRNAGEIRI